ncbi:MAG: hypothetical protein K8J31_23935, partial [Anaerolineae bacterium]|nr:hypothetical protein [Anaerolineae bacterium]
MTSDSRYSNHAQRALTHASLLAQHYHHPFADTSHLLVGVLRAEGSIGCQVMQAMNLSAAQAEPRLQALHPVWDGRGGEPSVSDALQTALELADRESAGLAHHYMG